MLHPKSTWIIGKMAVGAVAFMCSNVNETNGFRTSKRITYPNPWDYSNGSDRYLISFRFFVLSRLFEKRFYENKPTFDLGIICILKPSANDKSEFSLDWVNFIVKFDISHVTLLDKKFYSNCIKWCQSVSRLVEISWNLFYLRWIRLY